jgi:hypothetical protein
MKLIEINPENINYTINKLSNLKNKSLESKMVNINYMNYVFQFQTPKMILNKIIKENDKEYLLLQLIGNKASKTFYDKINEFEKSHNDYLKSINVSGNLKSLFNEDILTVKVPFKYSKPLTKIIKNSELFNYYNLKEENTIICLLECNNIWINENNIPNYHLIVKEIMII